MSSEVCYVSNIELKCDVFVVDKSIDRWFAMSQSSTGMSAPFTAVPYCLLAEQDVVVLEDLQVRGFVMGNRKEGLDLAHCAAVFR